MKNKKHVTFNTSLNCIYEAKEGYLEYQESQYIKSSEILDQQRFRDKIKKFEQNFAQLLLQWSQHAKRIE